MKRLCIPFHPIQLSVHIIDYCLLDLTADVHRQTCEHNTTTSVYPFRLEYFYSITIFVILFKYSAMSHKVNTKHSITYVTQFSEKGNVDRQAKSLDVYQYTGLLIYVEWHPQIITSHALRYRSHVCFDTFRKVSVRFVRVCSLDVCHHTSNVHSSSCSFALSITLQCLSCSESTDISHKSHSLRGVGFNVCLKIR